MEFRIKDESIAYIDETNNDNILAEIIFPCGPDGVFCITHTFVDESIAGQGLAGKLVEMAIGRIEAQGGQATATCPYAVKWMEKRGLLCVLAWAPVPI